MAVCCQGSSNSSSCVMLATMLSLQRLAIEGGAVVGAFVGLGAVAAKHVGNASTNDSSRSCVCGPAQLRLVVLGAPDMRLLAGCVLLWVRESTPSAAEGSTHTRCYCCAPRLTRGAVLLVLVCAQVQTWG
jgi:hypothetical protein